MSSGPGVVQRNIIAVFENYPDGILDSISIAALALDKAEITASEASSYRRALRQLAGKGQLVDVGRRWHDGRRWYALPVKAETSRLRVQEPLATVQGRR
jgi:hypothetical protein